ncbi:hypothetical protein GCM10022381_15510 [Leifsonia kafniensis]|uniref:Uncharacterized protein n=1 Tax=Leifsonia kafniensis TaxID=475957 RepID=A0ABP7KCZ3_9MICO
MNTHLAPMPGLQDCPPQPESTPEVRPPVRRVGHLDRAAMYLGIALIRWSRRPARAAKRRERPVFNAAELERRREADHNLALSMIPFR